MIKRLSFAIPVAILSLLLAVPVMAAYYINIDVAESNGTDYDMLAMNTPMDIDYLADNGFITEDGLDVRVENSQGSELPFMPVEDKLMFASAIESDKITGFQMTTGNSLLDSFAVCVGDGGYVTISDSANLELGDDFEVEWDGYEATSVADNLVEKPGCFLVYSDGGGNIEAEIYDLTTTDQTAQATTIAMYAAANTRVGQRIDNFPASNVVQLSFYLKKTGSPTGTGYVRIRETDDDLVGTLGTIDVATLTGSLAWYDFTVLVENPTSQNLRFLFEWSGGDAANKVDVGYTNSDVTAGVLTYYDGSWTDGGTSDCTFKLHYTTLDVSVTAAVSSGENKITVVADGSNLKIYEDDVEEDSVPLVGASVPDLDYDWVLGSDAIPYYDYYTHTTSDTLRITYEPDSIISGTTLPNEENPGTYDGTITWGSNPAGISIETSGLEIEEEYYFTGGETTGEDIFEPEPAELAPGLDSDKLDRNPLKPGVEGFAEASNGAFTESLVWYGIAWFSVIAVGITLIILVREHLVFAASVAFGLSIFWYVNGVFDYWVLIVLGILLGASLIHEKQPTW